MCKRLRALEIRQGKNFFGTPIFGVPKGFFVKLTSIKPTKNKNTFHEIFCNHYDFLHSSVVYLSNTAQFDREPQLAST